MLAPDSRALLLDALRPPPGHSLDRAVATRTEARRGGDRKPRWEDHGQYLAGLTDVLGRGAPERLIVMGDFIQVVGPGGHAPTELRSALLGAFPPGMTIATCSLAFQGRRSIDHIAPSEDLAVERVDMIPNAHESGRLSDHFGVVADVSARYSR